MRATISCHVSDSAGSVGVARQACRIGDILDLPHEMVTRELTAALLESSQTPRSNVSLSLWTGVTPRQRRRSPALDARRT